ncbi:hypothetical protein HG536_0G03710 [Torulaspora globosa]|uniref:T6SS Phospholipase effector Tle1-like catalytic domain-containing protein n=1 Tax=Torulaspora globosa TaxID=48254 RepID=A0A7G3ZLX3_9SACH|nr:uncharacterized protein HG536_0G03710 [Torulaspora globosa]QLL34509.1 hypothetical protein HG536_0G03710 [Torulaspora globosa]
MGAKRHKNLILCFDGTRENFGPHPISNVLKLYQMLKNDDDKIQMCYYQSGIGTEADFDPVVDIRRKLTLSHLQNITDAMFASSLEHHIVTGYIFLMENYEAGDQIFMFGFSRGAFIARALAGMLERVGLLNRGLTGMVSMAWRIYEKWEFSEQPGQPDYSSTLADEFKRTFSRSYEVRIHFQGLWDSVNSVGILRDKLFPCTQRSAIVDHVRHAVSLDERRGKYKQQLFAPYPMLNQPASENDSQSHCNSLPSLASDSALQMDHAYSAPSLLCSTGGETQISGPQDPKQTTSGQISCLNTARRAFINNSCSSSEVSNIDAENQDEFESRNRSTDTRTGVSPDLIEKWFPGDHSDIGGGWGADCSTREDLSNLSIRWMIAEAFKHGVKFKPGSVTSFASKHTNIGSLFSTIHDRLSFNQGIKLTALDEEDIEKPYIATSSQIGSSAVSWFGKILIDLREMRKTESLTDEEAARESYSAKCQGIGKFETFLWWVLEFIPIGLRIETQAGKWENVYNPNLGRHRYVPLNGDLHWSVFWRIKYDQRYRPSNLPSYARELLREFEGLELKTDPVTNINTRALPLDTYPATKVGATNTTLSRERYQDAQTLMQSLLPAEDLAMIVTKQSAKSRYLAMRKRFVRWAATCWQEFPDDLSELLQKNPGV